MPFLVYFPSFSFIFTYWLCLFMKATVVCAYILDSRTTHNENTSKRCNINGLSRFDLTRYELLITRQNKVP